MTTLPSFTLALGLLAQGNDEAPSARSQETPSTSALRMKSMSEAAKAVTLVSAGSGTKAVLIDEPLYRYDDPARDYADGTVWAFGKTGRPAALLSLSLERSGRGQAYWLHELTSIADGPVAASSRHPSGSWIWNPKESGLDFRPLPGTPAPLDDEPKRLRQMKEAARRFKANESRDPARNDPSDRFELRLLPQPVHRYSDPASGLVDGAIFLMAYGRNPEIALLIEARREGAGAPAWRYGLARISASRLRVLIDDQEVADLPKPVVAEWKNDYYLFLRPALGLKD